ncbi:MAG: zinc ribbon domain-containing protein [bacterium]|nr:zinc ribbon domain-containing protein [bacterium]
MFFFIGGVQPKTVTLEKRPHACPYCAHNDVRLKRTDQYIAVFFIPLIPIKKGQPYLACENCHTLLDENHSGPSRPASNNQRSTGTRKQMCGHCNAVLDPGSGYSYCPYCGKKI